MIESIQSLAEIAKEENKRPSDEEEMDEGEIQHISLIS